MQKFGTEAGIKERRGARAHTALAGIPVAFVDSDSARQSVNRVENCDTDHAEYLFRAMVDDVTNL
jgi:hypothetical protein